MSHSDTFGNSEPPCCHLKQTLSVQILSGSKCKSSTWQVAWVYKYFKKRQGGEKSVSFLKKKNYY